MPDYAALQDWITVKLKSCSIEDETFVEYILQLLQEETIPNDEKQQVIQEFLEEATVLDLT